MTKTPDDQVLERNVSTLLESGGETPRISEGARMRIRAELQHTHGVVGAARSKLRTPLIAVGAGLFATAAAALVISKTGDGPGSSEGVVVESKDENKLADGTTWTAGPGGMTVRETHQAMEAIALSARLISMSVAPLDAAAPENVSAETMSFVLSAFGKRIL